MRGHRHLWILVALAIIGCDREAARTFQDVDREARSLEAAVAAKTDLRGFRERLTAFTTELDRAEREADSPGERAIAERYEAVRAGLNDILMVWELKESRRAERLPIAEPLPGRLAREYSLPINTNEPPSIYGSEAVQMIWEATKLKLDAINRQ